MVVSAPMPSMPLSLWGDQDGTRYAQTYFDLYPGAWRQGDWITITPRDGVVVAGRSDATLNRGGVRLGSAEIYGVVDGFAEIADSLVVGAELQDGGYLLVLFVVLAEGGDVDPELREPRERRPCAPSSRRATCPTTSSRPPPSRGRSPARSSRSRSSACCKGWRRRTRPPGAPSTIPTRWPGSPHGVTARSSAQAPA